MSTIGITSSGNVLTVNGKTANAVNSVSGSVSGNNLNISVNGVAGQVVFPSSGKQLVTSGDISQFIEFQGVSGCDVIKDFDIEYFISSGYGLTCIVSQASVRKGNYVRRIDVGNVSSLELGHTLIQYFTGSEYVSATVSIYVDISSNEIEVYGEIPGNPLIFDLDVNHDLNVTQANTYRLFTDPD